MAITHGDGSDMNDFQRVEMQSLKNRGVGSGWILSDFGYTNRNGEVVVERTTMNVEKGVRRVTTYLVDEKGRSNVVTDQESPIT